MFPGCDLTEYGFRHPGVLIILRIEDHMESRDDKLLALVGLLAAGLIAVTILFTLTWLSDVRYPDEQPLNVQTCSAST